MYSDQALFYFQLQFHSARYFTIRRLLTGYCLALGYPGAGRVHSLSELGTDIRRVKRGSRTEKLESPRLLATFRYIATRHMGPRDPEGRSPDVK